MAGEWIKVETSTLNKPEVMRLARIMGKSKDHVVGVLIRFWIWLDQNCVDGHVDGVASTDIDEMIGQGGFCEAMRAVGWLDFNDHTSRIEVPRFDRHNGETAKKRALRNERQARWRDKNVDGHVDATPSTSASTREEKRRVIDDPNGSSIGAPTVAHHDLARALGVDCETEWAKYRDYLKARGKRHKDPAAGFRNWLRNAAKYAKEAPDRSGRRASNIDILTGRAERAIVAERVGSPVVFTIPGGLREPGADDVGGSGPDGGPLSVGRLARAV